MLITNKQLGRLTHYAFDAILISAFLAGIKRSTGLTYAIPILSSPTRLIQHGLLFNRHLSRDMGTKTTLTNEQSQC